MDKRYLYVVDVGASAIKVFVGYVDEYKLITVLGSGTGPAAGIAKAKIMNVTVLAESIKQAVDCAFMATNIPTENVYLGVGGGFLEFDHLKGSIALASPDKAMPEDAERACRAALVTGMQEGRRIVHSIPIGYFIDEIPYGSTLPAVGGSRLEVDLLAVTMEQDLYDRITTALREQGLIVAGIGANAIVGGQLLTSDSENSCLWIDMGADTTDVALVERGALVTAAALPFGGNYITSDIAQGLSVSWSHAEEIKRYYGKLNKLLLGKEVILNLNDYGTEDKHVAYDFLHMIVESRVDELTNLIASYIQNYRDTSQLKSIVITGGCAGLPSVGETLERAFRLPVTTFVSDALSAEYTSPEYFGCYSLARKFASSAASDSTGRDGLFQTLWSKVKKYI